MTKEELALIRDYIRSLPRHNASNTEPDALTYLRLLADALEQARQEGDALKEKLAERKIHGKCSCWRCLGCPSDPYADDEIGPEQSKGEAMTKDELERIKTNRRARDDRELACRCHEVIDWLVKAIEAARQEIKSIKSENAIAGLRYVGELARCEEEMDALKRRLFTTECERGEAIESGSRMLKELEKAEQARDEALMEGLRLTKLLEDKEIAARRPPRVFGCEVVSRIYLQAVHAEITALRAHKEASEAAAVALQKSNALLRHAAPLIYRRHTMVSGSLEMAECDAACKAAGLEVWRWPTTDLMRERDTATAVLQALKAQVIERERELRAAKEEHLLLFHVIADRKKELEDKNFEISALRSELHDAIEMEGSLKAAVVALREELDRRVGFRDSPTQPPPLEPIEVLRAIEGKLVEASNLLQDERLEENERFELLDMEINVALREVQAWKEEAEG